MGWQGRFEPFQNPRCNIQRMYDRARDGSRKEGDEFDSFEEHNLFNAGEIGLRFSFSLDVYTLDAVWSF